ncbi:RING finger and CHY zinc finger domain-containing protein 1-like [Tubulanus polymorphus]|uniref:RING finger and CHY zinc finger domain-containing protein 1-like n=1 Tax=Tubulanus polymorphus TaxID=672921 RepID=UPI003DA2D73D
MSASTEKNSSFGCEHYKRKCSLVAPCCGRTYPCRICHNDEEDHELDRKHVEEVVCGDEKCKKRQMIQKTCQECGIIFGNYFCSVCRLFDDVDKQQFHCDGCGICRIGGKDNYFHCIKCDVCLHNNLKEKHKCVEKASRNNCPVCLEDLHTSREECSVLPCGHLLHRQCMHNMLKSCNFGCAVCGQSMVDMKTVWEQMDDEIESTPMPDEYKDLHVQILCKDCHKESKVLFHVVGLKCKECGSYNSCRAAEPNDEKEESR